MAKVALNEPNHDNSLNLSHVHKPGEIMLNKLLESLMSYLFWYLLSQHYSITWRKVLFLDKTFNHMKIFLNFHKIFGFYILFPWSNTSVIEILTLLKGLTYAVFRLLNFPKSYAWNAIFKTSMSILFNRWIFTRKPKAHI